MSVGLADGLLYLCQNDTVTGSRGGLFLEFVCDQCLPHFALSWHTCCRSRMLYLNSICCFYSKYVSSFMGSLCTSISKTRVRFAFLFLMALHCALYHVYHDSCNTETNTSMFLSLPVECRSIMGNIWTLFACYKITFLKAIWLVCNCVTLYSMFSILVIQFSLFSAGCRQSTMSSRGNKQSTGGVLRFVVSRRILWRFCRRHLPVRVCLQ